MSEQLADAIADAAKDLNLSRQDVIRQTLKLFLPDFRDRMSPEGPPPFTAVIEYKEAKDSFGVSDAGHGIEWAAVRAIAHFFYKWPALDDGPKKGTFRDRAAWFLNHGLKIKMVQHTVKKIDPSQIAVVVHSKETAAEDPAREPVK